ncbi:hypothetical protein [Paenibacillus sp. EPM92]|uniref:hypothetical protein n=1 Tax=Paenibacillus sp. EPM92 TaxID=1561195 RepID=UPI0019153382|nr:hypothetical protein [Paenibacillus sp. EPM92]
MSGIALHEKRLRAAQFQFIFPFSLDHNCQDKLERELLTDGFVSFSLQQEELETAFYGSGCEVSHRRLEKFFLPFAKNMIFPRQPDAHAFRRYSKRIDLPCRMTANEHHWRFHLHAADMFVCPFDIGFLTLRVELTDGGEPAFTFSQALAFASRFRMLQSMNEAERNIRIGAADCESEEVEDFIFKTVVPALTRFLDESDLEESFFEKLPYFVDERMYVQGLLAFERQEEITTVDAYRASRLDGMDDRGRPYVSACNTAYIERFCSERIYDRWSPETWYMIEETSFVCLTRQSGHRVKQLVSHMYGEYYYALLINLFHKIVLLKLSNRYSHVQIDKDPDKIEKLIRDITTFSSKNFFIEAVSQSQGKDMYVRLRERLGIETLYGDVKRTLDDLFKYEENFAAKRSNYLLLILTIYTVVSGIFGMNLVVEDLKEPTDLSRFANYSAFQYMALLVAMTGIAVAFGLGIVTIVRLVREWRKSRLER